MASRAQLSLTGELFYTSWIAKNSTTDISWVCCLALLL